MAITNDGSLFAWGNNRRGQLGDGTTTDRLSPVQIMSDVVVVSAGGAHTMAITSEGNLFAWGENFHGQLGHNTAPLNVY
jgi:alpha-tubulin suppressor-like RCC1 family protein